MPRRSASRGRSSKKEDEEQKVAKRDAEEQQAAEEKDVELVPIPYPVVMQPQSEPTESNQSSDVTAEQDNLGLYEYEEMDTVGRTIHAITDSLAAPLFLVSAPRGRTAAGLLIGTHLRTTEENAPASAAQVFNVSVLNHALVAAVYFALTYLVANVEQVKSIVDKVTCCEQVYVLITAAIVIAALLPLVAERTVGELVTGTVILKDLPVVDVEISFEEDDEDDDDYYGEDEEDNEDEDDEDEDGGDEEEEDDEEEIDE